MRKICQLHDYDCTRAALASLLGVELGEIPPFDGRNQKLYDRQWKEFLRRWGCAAITIKLPPVRSRVELVSPAHCLLAVVPGFKVRSEASHHHVVGEVSRKRDGSLRFKVIWDPMGKLAEGYQFREATFLSFQVL